MDPSDYPCGTSVAPCRGETLPVHSNSPQLAILIFSLIPFGYGLLAPVTGMESLDAAPLVALVIGLFGIGRSAIAIFLNERRFPWVFYAIFISAVWLLATPFLWLLAGLV
jgi:hypothetical protein